MAKLSRLSFGSTAAIVTSMGLIVGLELGPHARATIISGLLLVAIADNLTDSLAMHAYQESERLESKQAFRSTITNFLARLTVAGTFVLISAILPLPYVAPVAIAWGLLLLGILTYLLARSRHVRPGVEVAKHLMVAAAVIVVSRLLALWIATRFS